VNVEDKFSIKIFSFFQLQKHFQVELYLLFLFCDTQSNPLLKNLLVLKGQIEQTIKKNNYS